MQIDTGDYELHSSKRTINCMRDDLVQVVISPTSTFQYASSLRSG
jgi:hypothetical protein